MTTSTSSLKVLFFCDETVSSLKVLLVMLLVTKCRFVTKGMTSSTQFRHKKIELLETKLKLSLKVLIRILLVTKPILSQKVINSDKNKSSLNTKP